MDLIKQAKAKSRPPPPPPPKPSHLSQPHVQHKPRPRSGKRGLGWPWDQPTAHFPLFVTHPNPSITWLFNWELWVPPDQPPSIEWTPCVRTAGQSKDIIPFLTDITTNQGRRITHFLGFNEPEIPDQANLGVDDAVLLWRQSVLPAKAKFGFALGSPGMSSDVSRSVPWLDAFLERLGGVSGAGLGFLVLHWYGPRFGDMRVFLEMMHGRYGLPVWVNEFACSTMGDGEASQAEVEAFLGEALPWLDGTEWVERYAYFGNGQGQDVGAWVGRASNFTEPADGCEGTGGRRLTRTGRLYLEL